MITHDQLWGALDAIAKTNAVSPSRMALNSGLDATTFNKSKRVNCYGKNRYPSLRTVTKVLNNANITMSEFGKICDELGCKK